MLVALTLAACGAGEEPSSGPIARVDAPIAAPQATSVPAATLAATATASREPTSTATATPTATSTPSPTPTPEPRAIQLTSGGCCTQPFWSPDGRQVRFIDKPAADAPSGIYGVYVDAPLEAPVLVSERVEHSTALPDYRIETGGDATVIVRLSDGERWTVPAGGRNVLLSPGRTRIAWSVSNEDLEPERRVAAVWVANLDGSEARKVATLPRGGVSGWIGEDALLVTGRDDLNAREQRLSSLSIANGATVELARAERLRSAVLSPSGEWIAYYVTFDADPDRNGLWLARTDGSRSFLLDRRLFGAYQWRGCPGGCKPGDDRLLLIPMIPNAASHELWELGPDTEQARRVINPAIIPFKVANGDWRVAPDGRHIAYVASSDRNIWAIALQP